MKVFQVINVAPSFPKPIRFLEELARNAWWCWNQDAQELLRRIDPALWRECGSSPLEFLRRVPRSTFDALAADNGFITQLGKLETRFKEGTAPPKDPPHGLVAYFSLEFGLHESIRLYSGGLGILAGDHLKAASDTGLHLAGVGLYYHQGYFEQKLNHEGWQQEHYPENDLENLPMKRVRGVDGEPLRISMPFPDGECHARVWALSVGGIPLYLLDANMAENPPHYRDLTARLYGGDHFMRLRQELLLAVGGFRALIAAGLEPAVCHMNEGHAGFLSIARVEFLMKQKSLDLDAAIEVAARANVFTTHTPVPAGNETFPVALVEEHLKALEPQTGVPPWRVIDWGRAPGDTSSDLSMTILGLRMAHRANGVSALHGDVARGMWQHVWPQLLRDELPIRHVTNGVHAPTWLSPEILALIQQYVGVDWETGVSRPEILARIDNIPGEELWRIHEQSRNRLVVTARNAVAKQSSARNATRSEISFTKNLLDPGILTIGFARRAASYKRATLLLNDPARLEALVNHRDWPVQFIFAGKAHPADNYGKDFIRQVVEFSRRTGVKNRFLFLENYDMRVARALVQGSDIWLNTPVRRMEASGTSGMKAAMNGVPNASILDGWWCEGYAPDCGWAIGNGEEYEDMEYGNAIESAALYRLLEDDIIPTFYSRPGGGAPQTWVAMMKASIKMAIGFFTSRRMVLEYRDKFYQPASDSYQALMAKNGAAARELLTQKVRLDSHWNKVRVGMPRAERELKGLHAGDSFSVSTSVFLGDLKPAEVLVELCLGHAIAGNQAKNPDFTPMKLKSSQPDGTHEYTITVPCEESGRFAFTARVVPAGNDWKASSPGYVTWAG
ncbi:MAG TPA: alpha-glucan family phosphorylase [Verrucomicrobiales bacterium]|nr:alpha-glucan family phosphorylase [Verrucomicrobiales bacterium]